TVRAGATTDAAEQRASQGDDRDRAHPKELSAHHAALASAEVVLSRCCEARRGEPERPALRPYAGARRVDHEPSGAISPRCESRRPAGKTARSRALAGACYASAVFSSLVKSKNPLRIAPLFVSGASLCVACADSQPTGVKPLVTLGDVDVIAIALDA